MPGHSLYRISMRWRFVHDGGFLAIKNVMPDLHKRFLSLGSKHKPRAYKVGGSGHDQDLKQILTYQAGVLEALQRWQTGAPNAVYDPGQNYDYDQITEIFVELIKELRTKKNRPGLVSPPWNVPALPPWNDDTISPQYDQWLLDRATEFRDELRLKPTVKLNSGYTPQNPPGSLGPVADTLGEILDYLTTAQP